ncbi:unnamed protein product [Amoebophrya sp. A120]|nr:unnamed protein product [Amoebophrya sp. A120]|eukprot:GSA120T00002522001.1
MTQLCAASQAGLQAKIAGLQSRPELNGARAKVLKYLPDKNRFQIRLASDEACLSVKATNLQFEDTADGELQTTRVTSERANAFRVMEVDGRGKGVIALEAVQKGELLWVETPVLSHCRPVQFATSHSFHPEEISMLWGQFSALAESDKSRVRSLANKSNNSRFAELSPHQLVQTFATNAFQPEETTRMADVAGGSTRGSVSSDMLFLLTARLNHSCSPNCTRRVQAGKVTVFAARNVEKGEELTFSYIGFWHDHGFRQQVFQRDYGFVCKCPVCSLGPAELAESDARRRQYDWLDDELPKLRKAKQWKELLQVCAKMRAICKEEGDDTPLMLVEGNERRTREKLEKNRK